MESEEYADCPERHVLTKGCVNCTAKVISSQTRDMVEHWFYNLEYITGDAIDAYRYLYTEGIANESFDYYRRVQLSDNAQRYIEALRYWYRKEDNADR